MKENLRKSDESETLDVLLGIRHTPKPARPVGRLKQLNKQAKRLRRLYAPVKQTDADNRY